MSQRWIREELIELKLPILESILFFNIQKPIISRRAIPVFDEESVTESESESAIETVGEDEEPFKKPDNSSPESSESDVELVKEDETPLKDSNQKRNCSRDSDFESADSNVELVREDGELFKKSTTENLCSLDFDLLDENGDEDVWNFGDPSQEKILPPIQTKQPKNIDGFDVNGNGWASVVQTKNKACCEVDAMKLWKIDENITEKLNTKFDFLPVIKFISSTEWLRNEFSNASPKAILTRFHEDGEKLTSDTYRFAMKLALATELWNEYSIADDNTTPGKNFSSHKKTRVSFITMIRILCIFLKCSLHNRKSIMIICLIL